MEILKIGQELNIDGYQEITLSDNMDNNIASFAKANDISTDEAKNILTNIPAVKNFINSLNNLDEEEAIIITDDFDAENISSNPGKTSASSKNDTVNDNTTSDVKMNSKGQGTSWITRNSSGEILQEAYDVTYDEDGNYAQWSERYRDEKGDLTSAKTFNANGNVIADITLNSKGQGTSWITCDDNGNITQEVYNVEYDENGNYAQWTEHQRDEKGDLTSAKTFNADGNVIDDIKMNSKGQGTSWVTCDDNGNITQEVYNVEYDENGNYAQWTEHQRDEKGDLTSAKTFNADGNVIDDVKMNSKGQGTSWVTYNDNGKITQEAYDVTYDENGRYTQWKELYRDENGNTVSNATISNLTWNSNGQATSWIKYDQNGKIAQEAYDIKYDENGNYAQWSERYRDENGNLISAKTFNANGNVIAETTLNSKGQGTSWVTCDDNGNITQEVYNVEYDDNGNYKQWTEHYRDENGDLTSAKTFNADGNVIADVKMNSQGQGTSWVTCDDNGNITQEVYNVEYDDNGNYRQWSEHYRDENGDLTSAKTFNADGNVIADVKMNSQGQGTSWTLYDGNGKITQEAYDVIYDENGNYKQYKERYRDANGIYIYSKLFINNANRLIAAEGLVDGLMYKNGKLFSGELDGITYEKGVKQ